MSFFKLFSCSTSQTKGTSDSQLKPKKLGSKRSVLKNIQMIAYSKQGNSSNKTHCQDTFCIKENLTKNSHFMAVYDGHGRAGLEASSQANHQIESFLTSNSIKLEKTKSDRTIRKLFKKAFNNVEAFFKASPFDYTSSGTCCVSMLIQNNKCYIANLGDSRGILARRGIGSEIKCIELSKDHKPCRPDEKKRIEKKGGQVRRSKATETGPFRVWGNEEGPGIAVSRTLGDLRSKEIGVIPEPEIKKIELDERDKFIVLASDGLWDIMETEEVIEFVNKWEENGNPREKSAEALVLGARIRWEQASVNENVRKELEEHGLYGVSTVFDDITVLIAYLDFGKKEEKDKIIGRDFQSGKMSFVNGSPR